MTGEPVHSSARSHRSPSARLARAAVAAASGLSCLPSLLLAQAAPALAAPREQPWPPRQTWSSGMQQTGSAPSPFPYRAAVEQPVVVLTTEDLDALARMPGGVPEGVVTGQTLATVVAEPLASALQVRLDGLLQNFGRDHPDVRSVRERLQTVRAFLARHPVFQPPPVFLPREEPRPLPLPPPPVLPPIRATSDATRLESVGLRVQVFGPITIKLNGSSELPPLPHANDGQGQSAPVLFPDVPGPVLRVVAGATDGMVALATAVVPGKDSLDTSRPGQVTTLTPVNHLELQPVPAPVLLPAPPSPARIQTEQPVESASVPQPKSAAPLLAHGHRERDTEAAPVMRTNSFDGFLQTPTGKLAGFAAAVFIGVMIQLAALILLLRRHGARLAEAFHTGPALVAAPPQATAPLVPFLAEPEIGLTADGSTAEAFDLGPTYEEEQAARQEAQQRQEEAVLQAIFEQNLQLRQELSQLRDATA